MKKKLLMLHVCIITMSVVYTQPFMDVININEKYSHSKSLQEVMNRYTAKDLPGIAVAVYSEKEGWWAGASGFSRTESKTAMKPENLQYIQSVSKTYMAVAILKLFEEGRIQLDAPIIKYLPEKYKKRIRNASEITVRMLLNHTSGIPEYVSDPEYTATVLLTPQNVVNMDEVLQCLENEEPLFKPGSRYLYTNTNYTLLAMIGDAITGDHARYINNIIVKPLGLKNTFYRDDSSYLKKSGLVDSYWDLLNAGRPANVTIMQKANVGALIGDDGIICTPTDAVLFLVGLMQGKLIKESTLMMMQQWVKNEEGREVYGLGLIRFEINGVIGYGHGGGGIGSGCVLIYIPEKKVYVFLSTNIGVVWDGLPAIKANEMKDEILKTVLR